MLDAERDDLPLLRGSPAPATHGMCPTISRTSTGSGDSDSTGPASMRAMSSTSLIRPSRCSPHCRIWRTHSVCASGHRTPPRQELIEAKHRTFIGVRSSWLMRERNSLLARFARSASSRAPSISSSAPLAAGDVDEIAHIRVGRPSSDLTSGNFDASVDVHAVLVQRRLLDADGRQLAQRHRRRWRDTRRRGAAKLPRDRSARGRPSLLQYAGDLRSKCRLTSRYRPATSFVTGPRRAVVGNLR